MIAFSPRKIYILIVLLGFTSLVLFLQRRAIVGTGFLFTFASLACLALAFFLLLLLPWKNRHLIYLARLLRLFMTVAAICFLISFTIVQMMIGHTAAAAKADPPDASCLLVLGAGLYRGEIPSYVLQSRLIAARDYLSAHPDSVAVLSGGQGDNEKITEALAMRRWLVNNDIAEGRLYLEELSTSTYENIAFSLPIIEELGYGQVIIATNNFHLLRASIIASYYGLDTQLLSAPTPKIFLIPATYFCREYFALGKALLLLTVYQRGLPAPK
ncbi:MAG: YdcF family protein [Clostridiales bacterium]|nr:YdcF family protein [Clostridiales bacterium]